MQTCQGFYRVIERENARVKSVAFHPKRPVVIIADHSGTISAYDYQLDILVHEFKDHIGPVRSVVYHSFLDLFASGGDDMEIRIWDYHTKRIITTFEGHKDYIRSLDFHPHQPYLLSTSDDQTVRIWNFQSKKLMATLPGHMHYVMSGKFFLEEFIISVSLDQTIRIWDYKNIKEKKNTILSLPQVYVKQILDGHDKGINGISVCKNMFATVSDDREVKVWVFDGNAAFEKEKLYHHQNIVSSVLLTEDYLISNGEDGILALYSFEKKTTKKFFIDCRFWCVAGMGNFYCVGHDLGFYVFSLENPEKVFCYENGVYYTKNKAIYFNNFQTEECLFSTEKEVLGLQLGSSRFKSKKAPPFESQKPGFGCEDLLVQYDRSFEVLSGGKVAFTKYGAGLFHRNYVISVKDSLLSFFDHNGDIVSEHARFDYERVFSAEDNLVATRKNVLFLLSSDTCQVKDFRNVNFEIKKVFTCATAIVALNRNNLVMMDYDLNIISVVHELAPINTGFFSDGTFFYSTIRQIKFLNKDCGMLKSLDDSFVFHRDKDTIYYLGSAGAVESVTVDLTEFHFKNAFRNQEEDVRGADADGSIKEIIESGDLPGLAPLSFLIKNKRGDIALPYVKDPGQKFELCLSNKKYRESLDICRDLNDDVLFRKLAEASLRDCQIDIAEECFLHLKEFNNLFLLYVCSKNNEKVRKLYKDAPKEVKIGIAKYLKDDAFIMSLLESREMSSGPHSDCKQEIESLERNCDEITKPLSEIKISKSRDEKEGHNDERLLYRKELLKEKHNLLVQDLDWEKTFKDAFNLTTEGRFTEALRLFKTILYSKIDDVSVRKKVSMYIQGLSLEKKRRKVKDPKKNVEMSFYFSSLNFEKVHKVKALKSTIKVFLKNGNFKSAKRMADMLGIDHLETEKGESLEDRILIGKGVFCYDVLGFREESKSCGVCYAHSSFGDICQCCGVGILQF